MGMNPMNPFRSHHRERLLDLSSDELVVRPGRLQLFDDSDEIARRHRIAASARHGANDPTSWVHRHLQRRMAAVEKRPAMPEAVSAEFNLMPGRQPKS